jgi:hypothetical protein
MVPPARLRPLALLPLARAPLAPVTEPLRVAVAQAPLVQVTRAPLALVTKVLLRPAALLLAAELVQAPATNRRQYSVVPSPKARGRSQRVRRVPGSEDDTAATPGAGRPEMTRSRLGPRQEAAPWRAWRVPVPARVASPGDRGRTESPAAERRRSWPASPSRVLDCRTRRPSGARNASRSGAARLRARDHSEDNVACFVTDGVGRCSRGWGNAHAGTR